MFLDLHTVLGTRNRLDARIDVLIGSSLASVEITGKKPNKIFAHQ